MKILCENCGQRFEELLNGTICPHCGRANPAPAQAEPAFGEPAVQPPVLNGWDMVSAAAEPEQEPEGQGGRVYAPPRRASAKLPLAVCLLLLLVLAGELVFFPLARQAATAQKRLTGRVPEAAVTSQTQNESFTLGPGQRPVLVGQAQRLAKMRGVEPGMVMVRVWCETKKQPSYTGGWSSAVYMEADGLYYEPVQGYSLEKFYPELMDEVLDEYELTSTAMAEGWFYFVLPGDHTEATLWLQRQNLDRSYEVATVEMVGVLVGGMAGANSLRELRYWTPWHVSAGPVTVTALPEGETLAYGADRDYYRLEFELTNNSRREVKTAYNFNVSIPGTERYDVRLLDDESTAEYRCGRVVPSGCTSKVSLVVGVSADVTSRQAELVFDTYDEELKLGSFVLP